MIITIFNKTAFTLLKIAYKTGLTYNAVNIIIYYMIVPLTWFIMLDFIIHCWPLLTILWTIVCLIVIWWHRHDFTQWCNHTFQKSVIFLLWFNCIGWDYYKASVIVCVLVPLLIYGILFILL